MGMTDSVVVGAAGCYEDHVYIYMNDQSKRAREMGENRTTPFRLVVIV
jgi:hypothetical protein